MELTRHLREWKCVCSLLRQAVVVGQQGCKGGKLEVENRKKLERNEKEGAGWDNIGRKKEGAGAFRRWGRADVLIGPEDR